MSLPSRRFRCLVIDDDPHVLALLRAYLEHDLGDLLAIESVSEARRARTMVADGCWDIVLLDIEIPGARDLEFLRLAREANPWCRVLVVTAHSTWDRIAEAIESGAADYLTKPVVRAELSGVVRGECDRLARWSRRLVGHASALP
ncbi:MAG: response regulator [Planctomycetes bacterium]|nr:response regulator [Planctomycetota bacterium]